jgi:YesN/AraC family two-component response regulator
VAQQQERLKDALNYYTQSLNVFTRNNYLDESNQNNFYIATLLFNQDKYTEAKTTFLKLENNLSKDSLKSDYYFSALRFLALIYSKEKKSDSAYYYAKLSNNIFERKTKEDKTNYKVMYSMLSKYDFDKMVEDFEQEKKKKQVINYMIFSLIPLLLFIIAFIIHNKRKSEHNYKKIIETYTESKKEIRGKVSEVKISDEQEDKILRDLQQLESKQYYLKAEFNQYTVAKKINTNTTYLSQIILKHKNYSFSDYTNELRINYLIKELMTNSKIRAYTMQALAELVGYKNGTSFSKIFKKKTGISPYQFIEKLKKEKT